MSNKFRKSSRKPSRKKEICKSIKVDETYHEAKLNKLKDRGGNLIKKPKQVIAVGLSKANRECNQNLSYNYLNRNFTKDKLISHLKSKEIKNLYKSKYKEQSDFKTKREIGKKLLKDDIINYILEI